MPKAVFLFFFLSGLSALVFEVSWVRELSLFLGNTAQATSTVLAVFMGGLALGAYLGGKQIDRMPRDPLWVYGLLEIAVGAVALIVSLTLQSGSTIYVWLLGWLPLGDATQAVVRVIMAATLLLVPTVLMGATLPVLVRYLEKKGLQAQLFSVLYGINTLGAAAGGMLACFAGFPYLGIEGTLFCAAATNVTIGASAAYLARQIPSGTTPADTVAPQSEETAVARTPISPLPLYLVAFLTGFTALGYEVLWTRVLRCFIGSITYAFSTMVAMFLLGLAIGSFLYERRLLQAKESVVNPFLVFSTFQYLAAFACAVGWLLFPQTSALAIKLLQMMLADLQGYHILYAVLVCVPTILVPAIFIGVLFPMLGTLAVSQGEHSATSVGKVYALNTIGCVCGSLVCGLLFVPTIGSLQAFRWIVSLSTLTGILASFFSKSMSQTARVIFVAGPLLLLLGYLSVNYQITTAAPGCTILASGEDSTGIISAIASPKEGGITLNVNHSFLSSTIPPARRYMRLLGHLPMLLHVKPKNVLVGCFGTGTTAGACALYPELEHLDIVDLSPVVLQFAHFFRNVNFDVLEKQNVAAHVNDVRNFLLSTHRQYDVISFEPPPPSDAGIVNLYTEDFYRLAARRLNPDGILCQWIPMHLVSAPLWKMQIASARAVFPHVSVWLPNSREAILLATKQPIDLDVTKMQNRIDSRPQIKESLHDVGFDDAAAMLSTYIMTGPTLDEYIKGAPTITDNFPRLEFFMAYPGRYLDEMDVETAGNVRQFVESNKLTRGFDAEDFWKNWQAIHALRLIDRSPTEEADSLINRALCMYPANCWFEYVASHRVPFYKTGHSDWRY